MALTGIEIFKLLPKKNCKECGFPTCLAFAMKLAAKQAKLEDCPYVSEEAKQTLGAASAPPVLGITIGKGEKAIKIGEETVLFRHEKTFVNQNAFALSISDTADQTEITSKLEAVRDSEIIRVGQTLRVDMVFLVCQSGSADTFSSLVKKAKEILPDTPLILSAEDSNVLNAALNICGNDNPLLYSATENTFDTMVNLAKEKKLPLVVSCSDLNKLSELTEKAKNQGVENLILDCQPKNAKEMIEKFTIIRRAAIKKGFRPLGYPILTRIEEEDSFKEVALGTICVCKYASIVILKNIEKWKMLNLFTLRQNIYTDPQVPMRVEQKIYKIGDPDKNSPLLITTNFALTYFMLEGEIETSGVSSWLAVMDVEGLSVLTAWAAGKFVASKIAQFIKESEVEKLIDHRELIIPGYVAVLKGGLEDKLEGWTITVGPRETNAVPSFLKKKVATG